VSTAANIIVLVAAVVVYCIWRHWDTIQMAQRQGVPPPAPFDYPAHKAIWETDAAPRRATPRGPGYWISFIVVVALAVLLTEHMPFGVSLAVCLAIGTVGGVVIRKMRR
jgi:hypothetical protein